MPNVDISTIKTLRDDVLLVNIPKREIEGGGIIHYNESDDDQVQYFIVVTVGPQAKHTKVGNVVLADWRRITPPQKGDYNGVTREYGVTSEKEILAIIEGYGE